MALAERLRTPRVAVALAFVVSAAWLAYQSWHVNSYIWLIDELLYMKYAVSYSDFTGFMPAVHGQSYGAPNLLFPVLVAPLFWVFSAPDAFTGAHVLNGIVYASAIFPVYLLARRIGASWHWALLGGLVAVWAPWAAATLVMMTEATAYAAFAWAILAITVSVVDPKPKHDLLAVVAVGLAILARTQLVFLLLVLPAAVVLFELSRPEPVPWRERLRARRALALCVAAGALLVAFVQLTGGNLIGSYEITTTTSLLPGGLWNAMMVHVAHLIVGVTIVPAIMWGAWLIATATAPRGPEERAAALVSGIAFLLMIHQAGWFSQTIGGGVTQERYVLYAVALFAVGLAALGSSRLVRAPRASLVAATLLAALAIAGSSFDIGMAAGAFGRVASAGAGLNERFVELQPELNSVVPGRDRSVTELIAIVTLVAGLLLTIAFTGRLRRWAVPALCVVCLVGSVAQTRWLFPKVINGIAQSYPSILFGVDQVPRDWVDQAAPDGEQVGFQPGRLGHANDGNHWMWTEFWNERLDREYTLAGRGPFTGWPGHALKVDMATGRVATPEVPELLVVAPGDPTLRLAGEVLETSAYGAALMRPAEPLRAEWRVEGGTFDGAPAGEDRRMRLSIFRPSRKVKLTLAGDPEKTGTAQFAYTIRDASGTRRGKVAAAKTREIVVEGVPAGGARSTVTIELPALALPEGNEGTIRILRIDPA